MLKLGTGNFGTQRGLVASCDSSASTARQTRGPCLANVSMRRPSALYSLNREPMRAKTDMLRFPQRSRRRLESSSSDNSDKRRCRITSRSLVARPLTSVGSHASVGSLHSVQMPFQLFTNLGSSSLSFSFKSFPLFSFINSDSFFLSASASMRELLKVLLKSLSEYIGCAHFALTGGSNLA